MTTESQASVENQSTPNTISEGPYEALPRGAFNMLTVGDRHGMPIAHIPEGMFEHGDHRMLTASWKMAESLKFLLNCYVGLFREERGLTHEEIAEFSEIKQAREALEDAFQTPPA